MGRGFFAPGLGRKREEIGDLCFETDERGIGESSTYFGSPTAEHFRISSSRNVINICHALDCIVICLNAEIIGIGNTCSYLSHGRSSNALKINFLNKNCFFCGVGLVRALLTRDYRSHIAQSSLAVVENANLVRTAKARNMRKVLFREPTASTAKKKSPRLKVLKKRKEAIKHRLRQNDEWFRGILCCFLFRVGYERMCSCVQCLAFFLFLWMGQMF